MNTMEATVIERRKCMTLLAASLTAFGLLLGGCGESDSTGTTVNADLREFSIELDRSSAPAGKVTFLVQNDGEDVHELVVLKTDIAPDKLPLNGDGDADEEAQGIVVLGEVEDIAPGKSGELTLELDRGKYVIICNISMLEDGVVEHHYPLGMYTGFTVE